MSSESKVAYSQEQVERLRKIHDRLAEARRELDALIGDAYLRSRASIVPVHFLDLSSAVEKLRWAEKEWRELERERDSRAPEPAETRAREDGPEAVVTPEPLIEAAQAERVTRS